MFQFVDLWKKVLCLYSPQCVFPRGWDLLGINAYEVENIHWKRLHIVIVLCRNFRIVAFILQNTVIETQLVTVCYFFFCQDTVNLMVLIFVDDTPVSEWMKPFFPPTSLLAHHISIVIITISNWLCFSFCYFLMSVKLNSPWFLVLLRPSRCSSSRNRPPSLRRPWCPSCNVTPTSAARRLRWEEHHPSPPRRGRKSGLHVSQELWLLLLLLFLFSYLLLLLLFFFLFFRRSFCSFFINSSSNAFSSFSTSSCFLSTATSVSISFTSFSRCWS